MATMSDYPVSDAHIAAIAQAATGGVASLMVVDDFVSGNTTSGLIGSLGWMFAGGNTPSPITPVAGHPGIVRRATGATINITAYLHLRSTPGTGVLLASELFDVTWIVRTNMVDTDTRLRIGFSDDWSSNTPANGIYFEKTLTDTQWFGVCRAASVENRTAALGTLVVGQWEKIRIRRIDAGSIGFTINGGSEVVLALTVPSAAVQPGLHVFNNIATDKNVDIDFFSMSVAGLSR